jgi:DNA-binding SARP family transcriptional activator/ActR/RegA family two-component response regulator
LRIQLLGKPAITDADGRQRTLRGQQVWAVLARILLSPRPIDRRTLALEIFPETDDPLGGLRWCLASLRRAMDAPAAFAGDPVTSDLPPEISVDVLQPTFRRDDDHSYGDLLEGVEPRCSPQFATWLLVERARLAGLVDENLRREALAALQAHDTGRAARFAERAVSRNPLDESGHILLVKSLVMAGRGEAAAAHVEEVEKLFLADLGELPSPALRAALGRPQRADERAGTTSTVTAIIDAGQAAVQAGAADTGVDLLRRAVADAERIGDAALLARATVELGAALVHSVRGHDDEGAILLGEALALARRIGQADLTARALRELGYVDALAGRRPSAAEHLRAALEASEPGGKVARTLAVMAFNLVDWGRIQDGLALHEEALEAAAREQDSSTAIFSLGLGSWGLLAAGEPGKARDWAAACLERVDQANWLAFRPFPVAMLCEARLRLGDDPRQIRADLDAAFALGCQLRDPCWEGATARAIALTYAREGDDDHAAEWLANARRRSTRETDTYLALLVQILADQAALSRRTGHPSQAEWTTRELLALAARTHADHQVQNALQQLSF